MVKFDKAAFNRGRRWAARRQELRAQGALTGRQLKLTEQLLGSALEARRTAKGPDDQRIRELMTDWLLIHEELGGK